MAEKVKTLKPVEGCPWCGATDRTAWGTCQICGRHYLAHSWARAPRRRRSFWWLANGYLYARDALNGSARWQFQAEGGIATSPLILGSRVYVGTDAGMLYALDRAHGALRWKFALGAPLQAAPVFASGRLYLRTRDGRFHAIE